MIQPDDRAQNVKSLAKSFKFAFHGIYYCIRNERNMRVHLTVAFYVLVFSHFYGFSETQYAVLLLTIAMVISAEAVNTAAEVIVNLHSPGYHTLARIAKDVSAGAVFVSALFAAVIGCLFFLKVDRLRLIFRFLVASPGWGIAFLVSLALAVVFIFRFPFKIYKSTWRAGRER